MVTASSSAVVRVAVPVPLRKLFDYHWPFDQEPVAGLRVRVPFGRRSLIGVVVDNEGGDGDMKLKSVTEVVDNEAIFDETLFALLKWSAGYYHHPLGEVMASAMPVALRASTELRPSGGERWRLSPLGEGTDTAAIARAPARLKLFDALTEAGDAGLTRLDLKQVVNAWTKPVAALIEQGLVETFESGFMNDAPLAAEPGPELIDDQLQAIKTIVEGLGDFNASLLHGVTGSGKTEVYIGAITEVLARGEQALVLVPEIALTPQLVERLRSRLGVAVAVLHSGLNDSTRHRMWFAARSGEARVVLGTRSAIYTPLANPGLIVIDEEHDGSYKQQDGYRYHARDVGVMRARMTRIPIVLGSATPSLESYENCERSRFTRIDLPQRVGSAGLPSVHLVDLSRMPTDQGLSPPLVKAIENRLARGEQSLIFLNRRGFAPVLICGSCRWQATCERCDARMTHHRSMGRLRCHHCGVITDVPENCPACEADALVNVGEGTQRVEEFLLEKYDQARIVRLDRDAARGPEALNEALDRIRSGDANIIVGTQMVAKGHDFPGLTLVGIVNADQGLYSIDFRAPEFLLQQIMQVTGRAGRADAPGEVLVQTAHPQDPAFVALASHDYDSFIRLQRDERKAAGFPPFAHLALLRCDSLKTDEPMDFLGWAHQAARQCLEHAAQDPDDSLRPGSVDLMDPVPSPMPRRAGRHRAQLLVRARERSDLHRFLSDWIHRIEANSKTRRVRWSVDVDPLDLY